MIDAMKFLNKNATVKRVVALFAVIPMSAAAMLSPGDVFAQQSYPPSAYSVPQPAPQYGGSAYTTQQPPASTTPPSYSAPTYGTNPTPQANTNPYGADVYSQPPTFNPTYPDPVTTYPPVAPYPPVVTGPEVREADLIIQGYPARTGRVMFGGAVNSDAGVTGQVTIDERNFDITRWPTSFQDLFSGTAFRGAGQTFRLEAVPGSEFQRYTVQFADPNLLGYLPISMSVSGFYYDRQFDDWQEGRLGGRLSFGLSDHA